MAAFTGRGMAYVQGGGGPPTPSYPNAQVRYRRVSTDENHETLLNSAEALKKQRAETFERINVKLQALVWVVVACAVVYYTDFFTVMFHDARVARLYFNIAMVCCGINICITLYLTLWLPYVKRINIDWSIYCPRMIPTATITGAIGSFMLVRALWPVWGFLTPLILLIVFMGFIFSLHFVPWPC